MKKIWPLAALILPGSAWASAGQGVAVGLGLLFILGLVLVGIFLYFVPSIVAYYRKASNMTTVLLVNIFLGWTAIGWIVSLILAFAGDSGDQARRHREMMAALQRNQQPPHA